MNTGQNVFISAQTTNLLFFHEKIIAAIILIHEWIKEVEGKFWFLNDCLEEHLNTLNIDMWSIATKKCVENQEICIFTVCIFAE